MCQMVQKKACSSLKSCGISTILTLKHTRTELVIGDETTHRNVPYRKWKDSEGFLFHKQIFNIVYGMFDKMQVHDANISVKSGEVVVAETKIKSRKRMGWFWALQGLGLCLTWR